MEGISGYGGFAERRSVYLDLLRCMGVDGRVLDIRVLINALVVLKKHRNEKGKVEGEGDKEENEIHKLRRRKELKSWDNTSLALLSN